MSWRSKDDGSHYKIEQRNQSMARPPARSGQAANDRVSGVKERNLSYNDDFTADDADQGWKRGKFYETRITPQFNGQYVLEIGSEHGTPNQDLIQKKYKTEAAAKAAERDYLKRGNPKKSAKKGWMCPVCKETFTDLPTKEDKTTHMKYAHHLKSAKDPEKSAHIGFIVREGGRNGKLVHAAATQKGAEDWAIANLKTDRKDLRWKENYGVYAVTHVKKSGNVISAVDDDGVKRAWFNTKNGKFVGDTDYFADIKSSGYYMDYEDNQKKQ